MARSKKPRSRPEAETSEAPPEDEVVDQETADPAEQEAPAPRKPRKKRGANLEVKASGDPEEVRDALGKMNPAPPPAVAPETEEDPPDETGPSDETIVRLLSNPRNKVVVFRTFPKRWNGAKCDIQVDPYGYRCPSAFEDIKQDVFRRFGGKAFIAYIQPVTLSGHSRVLAAIPFENPDTDDPQFEMPTDPNQVVDPRLLPPAPDGGDPTMMPEEDPMARIEQDQKTQVRIKARQLQIAQLNRQIAEFEGTKNEVAAEAKNPERSLEDRIALMQMENKLDRQIDAIRGAIEKISVEPAPAPVAPPPAPASSDNVTKILMAQLQMAENRFNALMAQQTQLMMKLGQGGGGKDDIDSQLERFVKLKAAFGEGDSRVKRLEQTLIDMTMERLLDGGGAGEGDGESDVKYAVKQLVPVIKNYVDKKLTEPEVAGPAPTKEQFAELVRQEAARVVQGLVKQGFVVKPQGIPGPTAQAPHPKIGAPAEKKERPKPPPQEEATKPPAQEEAPMEGPPLPDTPGYDRKKAVDFVLDGIVRDIDANFPEDTFLIGDALDHLDDEILNSLLTVSTGEDLEKVVGPHCTPEKLQTIKDRGRNPRVKTWLTRVITTIQDEYRKEVEGGGAEEAPKA